MDHPDTPPFPIAAPPGRPSTESMLQMLLQAGNLDRLAAEARRILERDPEDSTAHFYLVLALTDLKKPLEAARHLDFLLAAEPEEARTHLAAVCLHASCDRWRKVRHHVSEGLRIDPGIAVFHRFAAIAAMQKLDMPAARRHIGRARELDPEDADTVNLHIRIHGVAETSVADAAKRLEEYRAALRLDPGNAGLHNSIGDVLLNELADPAEAERAYREALRLEPQNRLYQRDLFNAVAGRSLTYRLFSIPTRSFDWLGLMGKAIARQPWRLVLMLVAFKAILAYFAWLFLATLIFWPGGKVYEWLLVSEIKRGSAATNAELRLWYRLRRWPRWVRFGLFLVFNLALWGGIFGLLGLSVRVGYLFVAAFSTVHLVLVVTLWLIRRGLGDSARRKLERRRMPPPLPARD